jgi:hypothetical protein
VQHNTQLQHMLCRVCCTTSARNMSGLEGLAASSSPCSTALTYMLTTFFMWCS